LQRTPQSEREKLEQYNHNQKHRTEHKANLLKIKKQTADSIISALSDEVV